ncbi:uncharacterized protein PG998_008025 [Apiospora kogelbergensis]|uniref:Uncharacterized protein n=1 Tax=Apiospora kogelbergensis TaxID=1337665 RepID=A0AAW0QCX1_9PEZI
MLHRQSLFAYWLFTSPPTTMSKPKDGEYRRASSTSEVGVDTEEPRGEEPRFLGRDRTLSKMGPEGDVEALGLGPLIHETSGFRARTRETARANRISMTRASQRGKEKTGCLLGGAFVAKAEAASSLECDVYQLALHSDFAPPPPPPHRPVISAGVGLPLFIHAVRIIVAVGN